MWQLWSEWRIHFFLTVVLKKYYYIYWSSQIYYELGALPYPFLLLHHSFKRFFYIILTKPSKIGPRLCISTIFLLPTVAHSFTTSINITFANARWGSKKKQPKQGSTKRKPQLQMEFPRCYVCGLTIWYTSEKRKFSVLYL